MERTAVYRPRCESPESLRLAPRRTSPPRRTRSREHTSHWKIEPLAFFSSNPRASRNFTVGLDPRLTISDRRFSPRFCSARSACARCYGNELIDPVGMRRLELGELRSDLYKFRRMSVRQR